MNLIIVADFKTVLTWRFQGVGLATETPLRALYRPEFFIDHFNIVHSAKYIYGEDPYWFWWLPGENWGFYGRLNLAILWYDLVTGTTLRALYSMDFFIDHFNIVHTATYIYGEEPYWFWWMPGKNSRFYRRLNLAVLGYDIVSGTNLRSLYRPKFFIDHFNIVYTARYIYGEAPYWFSWLQGEHWGLYKRWNLAILHFVKSIHSFAYLAKLLDSC